MNMNTLDAIKLITKFDIKIDINYSLFFFKRILYFSYPFYVSDPNLWCGVKHAR